MQTYNNDGNIKEGCYIFLNKVSEKDRYANENWQMTRESRRWLQRLEAVSTVDHSWADEVGDFDEDRHQFVVPDAEYVKAFKGATQVRILRDRDWYRHLRQAQPTVAERYYRLGDDHTKLLTKMVLGQEFGLRVGEIQQQLDLGESYHSHDTELPELASRVRFAQQQLIEDWTRAK